jgi:hypothetical protein
MRIDNDADKGEDYGTVHLIQTAHSNCELRNTLSGISVAGK